MPRIVVPPESIAASLITVTSPGTLHHLRRVLRVRIGDPLTVRLPSGDERQGTVFYRGIDAAFATQRDVSRTKRDIKTFEVRLRVDNRDRRLAVGMTAYVLLPVQ